MNIIENLTNETRVELLRRPVAFKAYIACIENHINVMELLNNDELCEFYGCGAKAIFDNRALINKALEERVK